MRSPGRPHRLLSAAGGLLALCLILGLAASIVLRGRPHEERPAPVPLAPVLPVPLGPPPEGGILHPEILQVSHARRIGDMWAIADWRAVRVHLLGSNGEYVRSFGGDGDGPGELRRPQALEVEGDSVLIVLDERRGTLERFRADGTFVGRRNLEVPACLVSFPLGIERAGDGIALLHNCARAVPPGMDFAVTMVPDAGPATRIHKESGLNFSRETTIRFAVIGGSGAADSTFWWAVSDRPCLYRLRTTGERVETRCLRGWAPVLLPDSIRRTMEEDGATAARGLRIVAPDHYPVMERVFAGAPDPILLTFLGEHTRALDRVEPDGSLTRLRTGLPTHSFVDGAHLLMARQETEGTRIWLEPLEKQR